MTDTPKRIWILHSDAMMTNKYQTVGGLKQVWIGDDGVEYIRADIHAAAELDRDLYAAVLAGAEYRVDLDWLRAHGIDGALAVGRDRAAAYQQGVDDTMAQR